MGFARLSAAENGYNPFIAPGLRRSPCTLLYGLVAADRARSLGFWIVHLYACDVCDAGCCYPYDSDYGTFKHKLRSKSDAALWAFCCHRVK